MDIDIFFPVFTLALHTILTYSYKFGLFLIAAFHPSPIFANDERLQDLELAFKTRFPHYRYRSVSVSELIRMSFWNIQFFSTQILQNLDFELAARKLQKT